MEEVETLELDEKPKKKKIKHLQGTDYVFSGDFSENYKIRNALAKYQKTV